MVSDEQGLCTDSLFHIFTCICDCGCFVTKASEVVIIFLIGSNIGLRWRQKQHGDAFVVLRSDSVVLLCSVMLGLR